MWIYPRHDSVAKVRIFTAAEGGRSSPVRNGIRWNSTWPGDPEDWQHGTWPEFVDASGGSVPQSQLIELGTTWTARVTIYSEDSRRLLKARICPGARFTFREGPLRVAERTVVALLTPPSN